MRFYGFAANEIVNPQFPNLDLEVDPKLSWALRHPEYFPVDINRADYQMILRIPGIGVRSAKKLFRRVVLVHFVPTNLKMGVAYSRAQHFMFCIDTPAYKKSYIRHRFASKFCSRVNLNTPNNYHRSWGLAFSDGDISV